jgi:hypothetical protein
MWSVAGTITLDRECIGERHAKCFDYKIAEYYVYLKDHGLWGIAQLIFEVNQCNA